MKTIAEQFEKFKNLKNNKKMKTISKLIVITISLFFTFGATQLNAQSWVRKYHAPFEGFSTSNHEETGGKSVVIDATGNVYVTGSYRYQDVSEGYQITTIKYSPTGVEIWVKRYSYSSGNNGHGPFADFGIVNALDNNGNLIVSGVCGDGYWNDVITTISYDPNGNQRWIKHYGGNYLKTIKGIVINSNNNAVYICGSKSNGNWGVNKDMVVLSYDLTTGDEISGWPIVYGGAGEDEATAICTDENPGGTNIFVAGYKTNGDKDVVLLRCNPDGTNVALTYSSPRGDVIPKSMAIGSGNVDFLGIACNAGFESIYYWDILSLYNPNNATAGLAGNLYGTSLNNEVSSIVYNKLFECFYVTGGTGDDGSGNNFIMTTVLYDQMLSTPYNPINFNRYSHSLNGSDIGRKVTVGSNGDVYICGTSLNPNTGYTDYSVFRYDYTLLNLKAKGFYNGTYGLGSQWGSLSMDKAYDMCIDASGRPIVTGYSEENNQGSHITTYKYPKYYRNGFFDFMRDFIPNLTNLMASINYQLVLRPIIGGGDISGSLEKDTVGEGKWLGLIWADSIPNTQYYIGIKGHNILETWSSVPVSFNGDSISFNFTTSQSQALGGNMKLWNGNWCFYTGDVNQDGTMDAADLASVENASAESLSGYVPEDVNGDEFVDASDLSIVENNTALGIIAITP